MEFLIRVIFEAVFNFVLGYPGAVIRWIFSRRKTFEEILESNMFVNAAIGSVFFGLIVILCFILIPK